MPYASESKLWEHRHIIDICPEDYANTAMCLWEHVENVIRGLKEGEEPPYWNRARNWLGAAEFRDTIRELAPLCHAEWERVAEHAHDEGWWTGGCYDWDWCPEWFDKCVVWDEKGVVRVKPMQPELTTSEASAILSAGLVAGEFNDQQAAAIRLACLRAQIDLKE